MSHRANTDTASTIDRRVPLLASVIAMMAVANLQYAWTLFTGPLTESLRATLSAVQVAFTLFLVAQTWLVPVDGYLIDKLGARTVVTAGGVLVGAGWIGAGAARSLGALYFWYTIGGVGAGAVYGAAVATALRWFPDRRGLASGLVAGAYAIGTALTAFPIQRMIDTSGYRFTFAVWGAVQGAIVLVMAQLMREPGRISSPAVPPAPPGSYPRATAHDAGMTPREMLATSTFWLMYLMMTMVALGGLMIVAQLRPIAATSGLDQAVLFGGVTAFGLALGTGRVLDGISRPFWGWISDRAGRYTTMGIAFSIEAAAILAFVLCMDRPWLFVLTASLVFLAWGEIYALFPAAISDVFGPRYAATNSGLQYTAKGTAAIFAGWGAAALAESTGSWLPALWVAAGLDLLAASLAFFWLRPLAERHARVTGNAAGIR